MNCCICKKVIETQANGWDQGHNPDPVPHNKGERCCSKCNEETVMHIRLSKFRNVLESTERKV